MTGKINTYFLTKPMQLFCIFALVATIGCTPPPPVYSVGILSGLDYFYAIVDEFKARLTELGYIEGKNIIYDIQKSDVNMTAYETILNKFVKDSVDLIFVFPTEATQKAKAVTINTGIPVVFANVFTEGTGLIDSVQKPGGNITGVRWVGPDIALQRFEIMRELLPQAQTFWVPYMRGYPIVESQLISLRKACEKTGIVLTEIPVTNSAELNHAFTRLAGEPDDIPDAILHIAEPISIMPDAQQIVGTFAGKHSIPVGGTYYVTETFESLFGLIPRNGPQARQVAFLADKVLKGAPAGALPVVSAECFLQISYRAIKKLGMSVNEGLLSRADKVIH